MIVLQWILTGLCGLVALHLLFLMARDRAPGDPAILGLLLIEAGLVVQLVWGIVRLVGAHGINGPAYVGYLVGALAILPVGYVWSAGEKSRGGTAVLLIAVLVLPVLFLRVHQLGS